MKNNNGETNPVGILHKTCSEDPSKEGGTYNTYCGGCLPKSDLAPKRTRCKAPREERSYYRRVSNYFRARVEERGCCPPS